MIRAFLALVLTSCVPRAVIEDAMDRDNDGYIAWQLDGDDCDDSDPTVRPGLDEVCGNGKDDDCDGNVDDDGVGSANWYPDADGDGFGVDAPMSACVQPEGHLADLEAGIDCDDAEDDANPGEPEVCGNDRDDDCDGNTDDAGLGSPTWYPDLDGDLYATNNPVQTCGRPANYIGSLGLIDCDDGNPDAHPGADEIWYDDVDEDCLGGDDFDQDGDDFASEAHGAGPDCDDTDDDVNPDAAELCFNSTDDDCDDQVDDTGIGAATWYPDLDQDGFAANSPVQACTQPVKHVSTLGTVDCNDTNSAIRPNATEIWYDGTDQNCNGDDDYDRDADGFRALGQITGGNDCEDTIFAVNPDADEVCDNGLDDDCDTTPNGCERHGTFVASAIASTTINLTNPYLSVGDEPFIADVSGDGEPDLVVAGYGYQVWVFESPLPAFTTQASALATFETLGQGNWRSADVGDFNGDGNPDIAIGRHEDRDVHVYFGPLAGFYAPDDSDIRISDATTGNTRFGWSTFAMPDLDGNGKDELLIGASMSASPDFTQAFHLFSAPLVDGWTTANRAARLYGRSNGLDGTGNIAGAVILSPGGPHVLAASYGDESYVGCLAAIPSSALSGNLAIQSHKIIEGVEVGAADAYDFAVGDVVGDGASEIAVGGPAGDERRGSVFVMVGPFTPGQPKLVTSAWARIDGIQPDDQVGKQVAFADIDGDGVDDLIIGSTSTQGTVVFYGPIAQGTYDIGDGDLFITGAGVSYRFAVGDLDADGKAELVVKDDDAIVRVIHGRGW